MILSSKLSLSHITLNAKNLAKVSAFYTEFVGLDELSRTDEEVSLGWKDQEIIRLCHTPYLPKFNPQHAGLYHLAILFEDRTSLANAVERVLKHAGHLYTGTADHLVSEAFYFSDPEGNGVELYFDKDPSTWEWIDGQIVMGSEYIEPMSYLRKYANGKESGKKSLGHVHLQVGSIFDAQQFYVDILGFKTTFELPTALFISDGKYHHHLGLNIWHSGGAGKRPASLGLKEFAITVEKEADLNALRKRLENNQIAFEYNRQSIIVEDLWGNGLNIRVMA